MNVFELTRALVDIESITENEGPVATYLLDYMSKLAARTGGRAERMDVEGSRFNVQAMWGEPRVTMSTHTDTVPPFFPSREDGEFIWGRGACDAKGLIAAMVTAAEQLRGEGVSDFGLLFVVGEERNSAGAYAAVKAARSLRRAPKYLINGEPTESKMAIASKGILRYELVARGKMAHSAYPELGESAIENLLDALAAIRKIELPNDPQLGPTTVNIGTISGGRAPNVIPDAAKAEIMIRLVGDVQPVRDLFTRAVGGRAELVEILTIPPVRFATVDGLPTSVVSFATDVPVFGTVWGQPLLFGPGSIHVAHTTEERISKQELAAAVGTYADMVKQLLAKN